jgi:ketosteroid isomerase-like protein
MERTDFDGGRVMRDGQGEAEATVHAFLAAMASRDLVTARGMLAPGFEMRFPGTGPMTELGDLLAWAKDRYRSVGKTVEAVEVTNGDPEVIWMRGTLHGVWPDGSKFEGIRFVDRFELRDGLIARQDVWNDLAEMRPKAPIG